MSEAEVADRTQPAAPARLDEMEGANVAYFEGTKEPVTSSVLISNSRYLNNPYYRDVFAQIAMVETAIEDRFPGQLLAPYKDWKQRRIGG